MASTKEDPEGRETKTTSDTSTGEPIAEDAASVADTPLQREQREITRDDVDEDGIHTGVTGPPAGKNDSVDDGNDPNRPNISPLGRDVKYPHQLTPPVDETHAVTVEDVEDRKDVQDERAETKRADVKADRGAARTSATDTPGAKR
jgi:hypothetical protein